MAKLKNAPVALIIMDGFGDGDPNDLKYNAIAMAKTPVIDGLLAKYKHNEINASGEYVGLPDGQMGNSEVGHTNIGAGRIVYQQLTRITRDIKNGDFFKNEESAACAAFSSTSRPSGSSGVRSSDGFHRARNDSPDFS